MHQSDEATFGRLSRIVKPEYPADALARGQGGNVELRGKVAFDGFLDDIELVSDKPESSIFVDTLRPLVPHWRFVPPRGNDCQPIPSRVHVTITFEVEGGAPHIYVTHSAVDTPAAPVPPSPHFKPLTRRNPKFPQNVLYRGAVAEVYARIVVDRSGNVTDVTSRAYSRQRGFTDAMADEFTKETNKSLSLWEYPPVPEGQRAPWIGCYQVSFRITN